MVMMLVGEKNVSRRSMDIRKAVVKAFSSLCWFVVFIITTHLVNFKFRRIPQHEHTTRKAYIVFANPWSIFVQTHTHTHTHTPPYIKISLKLVVATNALINKIYLGLHLFGYPRIGHFYKLAIKNKYIFVIKLVYEMRATIIFLRNLNWFFLRTLGMKNSAVYCDLFVLLHLQIYMKDGFNKANLNIKRKLENIQNAISKTTNNYL